MFDLEEAILQWKQAIVIAFGGPVSAVDELECHLRDEVDRLIDAGNPPENALNVAKIKLGKPEAIAAEFLGVIQPAIWWPALICLTLPILAFIGYQWLAYDSAMFSKLGLFWRLQFLASSIGYSLMFYPAIAGMVYVILRVIRPIGIAQTRYLGEITSIIHLVAAIAIGLSLAMTLTWSGLANLSRLPIGSMVTALWCSSLAFCWRNYTNLRPLILTLSMFSTSVVVWDWYLNRLWMMYAGGMHSYGYGTPPTILLVLASSIIVPAIGVCLGQLPAGSLRRVTV